MQLYMSLVAQLSKGKKQNGLGASFFTTLVCLKLFSLTAWVAPGLLRQIKVKKAAEATKIENNKQKIKEKYVFCNTQCRHTLQKKAPKKKSPTKKGYKKFE